ncbi:hypothetical protein GCM10010174_80970 [Kutzneria viridogrisea]|uniref:GNAT superfamily N-acetyltransferase n=1 Tax=Kutzneria viridogrisea TaxID=47990 RepID=A0ABR6BZ14_9PSEU|nr:GNAT superfamily N-acetyltransferase [Kutzneria viridogrisea]
MIIRQAVAEDASAILDLRRERRQWLQERGSDQWSVGLTEDGFLDRVSQSINDGATWVAVDDNGQVLACIAIDQWTNPGLWSDKELAEAVIVHRMITRRSAAGRGIGDMLLEHANRIAIASGRRWIRLDAWTTNTGLHRYYLDRGFRYVRTGPNISTSTALFEREAAVTVASTVQQVLGAGAGLAGDLAGNTLPPQHIHVIDDLIVQRPPALGEDPSLEISPDTTWRLWWEQDAWRIARPGTGGRTERADRDLGAFCQVLAWPSMPVLDQSSEYLLRHRDSDTCQAELVVATP